MKNQLYQERTQGAPHEHILRHHSKEDRLQQTSNNTSIEGKLYYALVKFLEGTGKPGGSASRL